jgi:hypothetical protein
MLVAILSLFLTAAAGFAAFIWSKDQVVNEGPCELLLRLSDASRSRCLVGILRAPQIQ